MLGVPSPSYYHFDKAVSVIEPVLKALAETSMDDSLSIDSKQELCAMSDCGWNFRNGRSPMGNVTFNGLSSRKIIAVCPSLNTSVARNFDERWKERVP